MHPVLPKTLLQYIIKDDVLPNLETKMFFTPPGIILRGHPLRMLLYRCFLGVNFSLSQFLHCANIFIPFTLRYLVSVG